MPRSWSRVTNCTPVKLAGRQFVSSSVAMFLPGIWFEITLRRGRGKALRGCLIISFWDCQRHLRGESGYSSDDPAARLTVSPKSTSSEDERFN